jgi:hypothetical protein
MSEGAAQSKQITLLSKGERKQRNRNQMVRLARKMDHSTFVVAQSNCFHFLFTSLLLLPRLARHSNFIFEDE